MHSLIELMPIAVPARDLLGAIQVGLALLILLLCGFLLAMWRVSVAEGTRQLGKRKIERSGYQARK
jgi:hypothetical protein